MFKRLYPIAKRSLIWAMLAALAVCTEVCLETQIPRLMADIIDRGLASADRGLILERGWQMVALALLGMFCGCSSSRFGAISMSYFGADLRRELFERIQNFSKANIDALGTAPLITRLTTDVSNVQNAFTIITRQLVRSPFMLVAATFMSYQLSHSLALVFLTCAPLMLVIVAIIASYAVPNFKRMLDKTDDLNAFIQENLTGIRVVKAFVREIGELKKFEKIADDLRLAQRLAELLIATEAPVTNLIMYATMAAAAWFGGQMVLRGEMATGALVGFSSYIVQIVVALTAISMGLVGLVLSLASIRRIDDVLRAEPLVYDLPGRHGFDPLAVPQSGSLEFRDVCFNYAPGAPSAPPSAHNEDKAEDWVINHVSFQLQAGQTLGILGETGSAKTTLIYLLPRFHDISSGSILLDGRDIRSYSLDHLRQSIAMVLQQNVLFSGTVRDNMSWGNAFASDKDMIHALKTAQIWDFLNGERGLDTQVKQGGYNFSGGQRQRLCIARALVRRPRLLIMDDSTSALDSATDNALIKSLHENMSDTTVIMISQKVSSIRKADLIMILDDGRVAHLGTPKDLKAVTDAFAQNDVGQEEGGV